MTSVELFYVRFYRILTGRLCRNDKEFLPHCHYTCIAYNGSSGFGNLRTANWRTGNMRTNMRTRPLIGRDVTRVPRAVRKVLHAVRSSHCFVSRPNKAYFSIAESHCICLFMTTVFGQLFVSVT